jgi:hypothetical protein
MQPLHILNQSLRKIRANGRVIWLPFLLKWAIAALLTSISWNETGERAAIPWYLPGFLISRMDLAALAGPGIPIVIHWGWPAANAWAWVAASVMLAWWLQAGVLAALVKPALQRRLTGFFRDGSVLAGRMIRTGVLQLITGVLIIWMFDLYGHPHGYVPESPWKLLLLVFFLDLWGDYIRGLIAADRLTSVLLAGLSAARFMVRNLKSVVIIGSLKAVELLLVVWAAWKMETHSSRPLVPLVIWVYILAQGWHYAAVLNLLDHRAKKARLFPEH